MSAQKLIGQIEAMLYDAQKLHVGLPLDQMLDAQEAAVHLQKAHIALMKVERARRAAQLMPVERPVKHISYREIGVEAPMDRIRRKKAAGCYGSMSDRDLGLRTNLLYRRFFAKRFPGLAPRLMSVCAPADWTPKTSLEAPKA